MKVIFAENLKALRNSAELHQKELAEKLETTQRKISYWESGKIEPDLESLWKIADFFNISIDALIGKEDF